MLLRGLPLLEHVRDMCMRVVVQGKRAAAGDVEPIRESLEPSTDGVADGTYGSTRF